MQARYLMKNQMRLYLATSTVYRLILLNKAETKWKVNQLTFILNLVLSSGKPHNSRHAHLEKRTLKNVHPWNLKLFFQSKNLLPVVFIKLH